LVTRTVHALPCSAEFQLETVAAIEQILQ
jgi:hypothetical protein